MELLQKTPSTRVALLRRSKIKGNPDGKHLDSITVLRGVASLMVFLFHLICLSNNYVSNEAIRGIFQYGKYGVELFFVVSGFVITFSMCQANYTLSNFFLFIKKRLIRLEPPYLVVLLLIIVWMYIRTQSQFAQGTKELPSISQVLWHLGYLIPFSDYDWLSIVFWTLAIEFQFYLIFSLCFTIMKAHLWGRIAIAVVFSVASMMIGESHFFHWWPVFFLGIILAFRKKDIMSNNELIVAYLLATVFIFLRFEMPIFIFAELGFFFILFSPTVKNGVLLFLGNISYSLYLLHTLVGLTIINLGIRYGQSLLYKVCFVTLAIVLTIFSSYLLYIWVEKPCKKLASSIKYRK